MVIQPVEAFNMIGYLQASLNEAMQQQLYFLNEINTAQTYRLVAETGLRLAISNIMEHHNETTLLQQQLSVAQQRLAAARGIIEQLMIARNEATNTRVHNQQVAIAAVNDIIRNLQQFMRNLIWCILF